MTGPDNAIMMSKKIAKIFHEQPIEDVMATISILLAFAVGDEEEKDGMKLLMLVVSQAAELAFNVSTEIITEDQIQ